MTTPAAVALVVAALFALGDWYSRLHPDASVVTTRIEYVCKPATLVALIAAAALVDPSKSSVRMWFVAALVLSLIGDVLLMLPKEQFVGGLSAFLLAHLCYIGGFVAAGLDLPSVVLAVIGTALVVSPVASRVLRGVAAKEPALKPPVVAYLVVIGTMLAFSAASRNPLAAIGALLFVTSDSMIAWSRFVVPFEGAPVAIMVTYHLAQAALVLSLLH